MKIHWHKRAAAALHQVEEYILQEFGERIRREFMDEVDQAVLALADMPTMGKIDPLFAHRSLPPFGTHDANQRRKLSK